MVLYYYVVHYKWSLPEFGTFQCEVLRKTCSRIRVCAIVNHHYAVKMILCQRKRGFHFPAPNAAMNVRRNGK